MTAGPLLVAACSVGSTLAGAVPRWPVYPGTAPQVVSNGGESLEELWWFHTEDPVEQVALYFAQAWRDDGWTTNVLRPARGEWVVCVLAPRERRLKAVMLRRGFTGTVGVMASASLSQRGRALSGEGAVEATPSPAEVVSWQPGSAVEVSARMLVEARAEGFTVEQVTGHAAKAALLRRGAQSRLLFFLPLGKGVVVRRIEGVSP